MFQYDDSSKNCYWQFLLFLIELTDEVDYLKHQNQLLRRAVFFLNRRMTHLSRVVRRKFSKLNRSIKKVKAWQKQNFNGHEGLFERYFY